jgi:dipeptidyl aminopeptidase/acylaminoacyl peptidase
MNADGTGATQLTFPDDPNSPDANAPMWSPDGSKIAFWSGFVEEGGNIFTMNPDGSGRAQLTFDPFPINNDNPSWSPDGKFVIFDSTRDNTVPGSLSIDTWIVGADGDGLRLLSSLALGGQSRLPITAGDGSVTIVGASGETIFGSSGANRFIDATGVAPAHGRGKALVD